MLDVHVGCPCRRQGTGIRGTSVRGAGMTQGCPIGRARAIECAFQVQVGKHLCLIALLNEVVFRVLDLGLDKKNCDIKWDKIDMSNHILC